MENSLLAEVPEQYLIDGVEQGKVLDRGAYGVVFEGQWRKAKVAIKRHYYMLVRDENGQLSYGFRKFLEEFPLLKEFPHPNIVQVFGMARPTVPQGTPGLVMEFLHQTLRKRYAESPRLSRLDEATVSLGVVSALDYLHSRNVIHRDLTTNNIMVCDAAGTGGEVKAKITDVGGAAVMADGAQSQSMTMNPGAQIYMAPETQRRSRREGHARYGKPADCYSYGISMMAMCNRREPPGIFTLANEGQARDVESLGDGHPLRSIILRCLEVDPSLRPSASQLCSDIAEVHLCLKDAPAERTTAATRSNGTSNGRPADPPDLASARAEIATLRQAMTTMDGQRADLLEERTGLLTERDDWLRERDDLHRKRDDLLMEGDDERRGRDALRREHDELVADRDSLSAANESLQQAVTDAGAQRDDLMRNLRAERDRLAVENAQLRQQDLSSARQAESRQQLARAPHHAAVLELIASKTSETGMLARCSLIRPPNLDHRNLATLPKWVPVGNVPACQGMGSMQCIMHNRLFVKIKSPSNEAKAVSAPLDALHEDNWSPIGLPPDSATEGSVSQNFFSYKGELYVCVSAPDLRLPHGIWKRSELASTWEFVKRMPQYRCRYTLAVVDDCLVVAGGSSSPDAIVRVCPDVVSLSLVEDDADWVAWPGWPSPSSAKVRLSPNVAATAGQVHIIGGELTDGQAASVLTADLSDPPQDRVWSSTVIPSPPLPRCAAVVANDHLVVCGGLSPSGSCSDSFMFSPVSGTWLPLPDILTRYIDGIRRPGLHPTDQGILMVSRHGVAGLRW